jgi:hypothetical protein
VKDGKLKRKHKQGQKGLSRGEERRPNYPPLRGAVPTLNFDELKIFCNTTGIRAGMKCIAAGVLL